MALVAVEEVAGLDVFVEDVVVVGHLQRHHHAGGRGFQQFALSGHHARFQFAAGVEGLQLVFPLFALRRHPAAGVDEVDQEAGARGIAEDVHHFGVGRIAAVVEFESVGFSAFGEPVDFGFSGGGRNESVHVVGDIAERQFAESGRLFLAFEHLDVGRLGGRRGCRLLFPACIGPHGSAGRKRVALVGSFLKGSYTAVGSQGAVCFSAAACRPHSSVGPHSSIWAHSSVGALGFRHKSLWC